METPRVNPVGVLEYPAAHASNPRQYSPIQRLFAIALLVFFFVVTVVTSAISLGSYCLTTDGADGRALSLWNSAEREAP